MGTTVGLEETHKVVDQFEEQSFMNILSNLGEILFILKSMVAANKQQTSIPDMHSGGYKPRE